MSCKCHSFQPEQRLEGFSEDAQAAMQAAPNYFAFWDGLKGLLLVGAVAALAYQVGKGSR